MKQPPKLLSILLNRFALWPAAPGVAAPAKKKIGFSVYDMQSGFFQDMEKGTREAADAACFDYVLVDQKSSESAMVSATQDLLDQGISALIISPFKPDALGPIVDAAKAKKIPVVIDDIGGGGTDYDVIVISDNEKGGVIAADHIDSVLKQKSSTSKKVASISCEPSAVYAARRNAGFEKHIKELGNEVVASLSPNIKQEKGYKVAKDILSAHPDVTAIFCGNDPMAVGAAQAVADSGKSGGKDVYIFEFNGDKIPLHASKPSQMGATIQHVPKEMGKMTVDLASTLIKGDKVKYSNPANREVYVPVKLITAADVNALLKK